MFVYDTNLLVTNVDDAIIRIKVARGLPLGSSIHKVIYVSKNSDILISNDVLSFAIEVFFKDTLLLCHTPTTATLFL